MLLTIALTISINFSIFYQHCILDPHLAFIITRQKSFVNAIIDRIFLGTMKTFKYYPLFCLLPIHLNCLNCVYYFAFVDLRK